MSHSWSKTMAIERTLAIIKPNAVANGNIGQIIDRVEREKLVLKEMRMIQLTPEACKEFYQEHVGKPFYHTLESFMIEGPVVVICLEGENAIVRWRNLMGATDPAKAAENTLRSKFGESHTKNATHGSDSVVSSARELNFFFGTKSLI
jgi:nucleoside-diphosphate kinase